MDPSEERYHPSLWAKRLQGMDLIRTHLDFWKQTCPDVHERIPCALDVPYGPATRDVYDVFGVDLPDGSPLSIFLHGGYWQEESVRKETYRFLIEDGYSEGVVTVLMEYEVCPNVGMEEMVRRVTSGIRTVVERFPKRSVHLMGHSAGAHLILNAYRRLDVPIASLVLLCGVYDLRPIVSMTLNEPLGLDESSAEALSPTRMRFDGAAARFVVVTAEYDAPALIENGDRMYEWLKRCGVDVTKVYVRGVDHFDAVERLREEGYELRGVISGLFKQ